MSDAVSSKAKLTTLATFPENYFLENLAVRDDNSVLVTAFNHKELWYVPTDGTAPATPVLLHTFDQLTLNLTEVEPDVFYLCTSNVYTDHKSSLYRIDLRNWSAGAPIQPQKILDFPDEAGGLNGGCLVGPRTILVANSIAGLIWQVDLPDEGASPSRAFGLSTRAWGTTRGK